MSTQRFEGSDIAALLTQMHDNFGSEAKVVAANRCRTGGVAGFFARESFEIYVEVPPAEKSIPTAASSRRQNNRDSSAMDQMIAAADRADSLGRVGPPSHTAPPGVGQSSNAGRPFAAALHDALTEQSAKTPRSSKGRSGSKARGTRVDEQPSPAQRSRFGGRRKAPKSNEPANRIIDLVALESAHLAPTSFPEVEGRAFVPGSTRVTTGSVPVEALRALGIPDEWLVRQSMGRALMHEVLANIAPPPLLPATPGSLVAFIGNAADALSIARSMAKALHQDPDDCVLLSPRPRPTDTPCEHVGVIDDLVAHHQRWSANNRVTIVAIDTGFGRQDIAWSRHAVSVLRPSMRWGVIDATRKGEDVRAWARGLGGLHALAVTGMSCTTSPASIFQSGVPVARIDGQIATPQLWLKLLEQRLDEATHRRTPDLISA